MKIETKAFKTNECAIMLTMPLCKNEITMNALIPQVLRSGCETYKTQYEIGKELEKMYGASLNCATEMRGDYYIMKFYVEVINEKYLPVKEKITQEAFDLLLNVIFHPYVENGGFKKEYVDREKSNLKKIIESRQDNKASYAYGRCIEEMFKNEPYGVYSYGKISELEKIDEINLFQHYKKIIQECRIDTYVVGENTDNLNIPSFEKKNIEVQKNEHEIQKEPRIINEELDVTQGKLLLGLDTRSDNKFATVMYNTILGGGANSKLFQNVREKEHLAYSASSRYIKRKNAIIISTGIELSNYDKAISVIKKQLEDMKNGKITDSEIESARKLIVSSMKEIPESQDALILFDFDQRLFAENYKLEEYIKNIESVTKEQIIDVANNISINTIYYLRDRK